MKVYYGSLKSHLGYFVEVGGCQQWSDIVERAMDIQEGNSCVTLQKARSNMSESFYMNEHMNLIISTRFLSTCTIESK